MKEVLTGVAIVLAVAGAVALTTQVLLWLGPLILSNPIGAAG